MSKRVGAKSLVIGVISELGPITPKHIGLFLQGCCEKSTISKILSDLIEEKTVRKRWTLGDGRQPVYYINQSP